MINCDHFEGRTRGGRKLAHADQTEHQIRLGLQLKPEELVSWIRAPSTSESLVEEAMVFLLLHHRATGDHALVETLAAALDQKMTARVMDCHTNLSGATASRELCEDVASLAWIILLEAPTGRGIWLQLCFGRFIHNLARDVLRRSRQFDAVSVHVDAGSDRAEEIVSQTPSLEDLVCARDMLSQLKPRQRQAFVLQHGFREPQRAIARMLGRSDRSVRTWLKQPQRQLNVEN